MRRLATVVGAEAEIPSSARADLLSKEAVRNHTVALFRDLREPLARYLASLGVETTEIEEIVQEAFLRLYRHLSGQAARGEDRDQNLNGWVFRVALNLVRDRQRGWHTRNVQSIEDRPEAAQASAPGSTPEERVLHLEKMKRLQGAWQALPDQQRRCLQLRSEGLRYREIGEALGMGTTTVADLIRNALAQLERARDHD